MIVVALIAIAAGVVSLSLRDSASSRLQVEAQRLSALLESARAESRASGIAVYWLPKRGNDDKDYQFIGLAKGVMDESDKHWGDPQVSAEVDGASGVTLGPEPLIGKQRILLRLGEQHLKLVTDGLGPFVVEPEGAPP